MGMSSPFQHVVSGMCSERGAGLGTGTFTPRATLLGIRWVSFCFVLHLFITFIYLEEGAMVLMWRSKDNLWLSFFSYQVDLGAGTHGVKICSKSLYLLNPWFCLFSVVVLI